MTIKEVYSIRISREDSVIKKYLEQFPIPEQNKALKTLVKYGAERLHEDFLQKKAIKELNKSFEEAHANQMEMLEEIKDILKNTPIIEAQSEDNSDFTEEELDIDKMKDSMKEALSMFTG